MITHIDASPLKTSTMLFEFAMPTTVNTAIKAAKKGMATSQSRPGMPVRAMLASSHHSASSAEISTAISRARGLNRLDEMLDEASAKSGDAADEQGSKQHCGRGTGETPWQPSSPTGPALADATDDARNGQRAEFLRRRQIMIGGNGPVRLRRMNDQQRLEQSDPKRHDEVD